MDHRTLSELESNLDSIRQSPPDDGRIELIVRRPRVDEREILEEGVFDIAEGIVGDSWRSRGSTRTPDGSPHPDMQLNVMNARVAALVAGQKSRWALAGDQLYLDLDLSDRNLPAGTRLRIGSAVIEITDQPHRGCKKFAERFGHPALLFVNSPATRELRLRGANAKVIVAGTARTGDRVKKL